MEELDKKISEIVRSTVKDEMFHASLDKYEINYDPCCSFAL
jgi:hypothetical protein